MERIYLDYASITPVDKRVVREMKKYSRREYANPSAWHKEGVEAGKAIIAAREKIAGFIHAHPDEIVFTSGGTEANNIAIMGTIEAIRRAGVDYKDIHILGSAIEHSSVRECFVELKRRGVEVEEVKVDSRGGVLVDDLEKKIRANTVLISVMMVNNETGVVQPIREVSRILRHSKNEKKPLFHTDVSQAVYQELNVEKLGIDLLTLDASKMYGPSGTGALFVRRNTPIEPIIFGGGQENGLRSGTENLPGVMGFAKAVELLANELKKEVSRLAELKRFFTEELMKIRPDAKLNGEGADASPHIANISIPGIDNEFFVLQLDAKGVACSTKSSCLRDEGDSYVLRVMGADGNSSVRFSFGRWTTRREIKRTIRILRQCGTTRRIPRLSP